MPVRALFSSFLLLLLLVAAPAASAEPKSPRAKIALGATKPKKKKHKATKATATRRPVACANTELTPDATNLPAVRAAIVCLHNRTRGQNGLRSLAENAALAAAAGGHADDMVGQGFFEHTSLDGRRFDQRIVAAGYARADEAWTLGENLIWATGEFATPAALMRSWLDSHGHRTNVLKSGYRELGVGIALGTPTGAGSGVTIAVDFGAHG